jgi:hypothetical protein
VSFLLDCSPRARVERGLRNLDDEAGTGRWVHVRIRLIRKLAERLDGIDLSQNSAGDVIDLPDGEARTLLAEGWASIHEARRAPDDAARHSAHSSRRRRKQRTS